MLNAPPYFLIFILYFSSPKQNLVHSLPNLHDHTQPPPNTMLHPNTTSCFNIVLGNVLGFMENGATSVSIMIKEHEALDRWLESMELGEVVVRVGNNVGVVHSEEEDGERWRKEESGWGEKGNMRTLQNQEVHYIKYGVP